MHNLLRSWRARLTIFTFVWQRRLHAVRFALRLRPMAGAEEPPGDEKKFTQADVDRIVSERLQRDRATRDAQYADYDAVKAENETLKAAKTELDQLKAADQTELERAQAATQAAETAKAEAEQRAQEARDQANTTLIRAQVIAAAAKAGAVDPDDVYALMQARQFTVKKEDQEIKVALGDDGQVTGHEEAVTAFLEGKPNLVGETPRPGPGDGGPRKPPPGALTKEALAQMTPQQVAALKPEDVNAALAA